MVQDLSRREEQRGWRKVFIWGIAAGAILGIIAVAAPLLTDYLFISDDAGMEETTKTPADIAEEAADEPVGVAAIDVKESSEYGAYLADGDGRALYMFEGDKQGHGSEPGVSTCYDDCAKVWPPLTTSDTPTISGGVDESLLGTTERREGTKQVTYNGWPLYHFAKDFGPNEATGQDVEDFGAEWYLVTPEGRKLDDSVGGMG